MRKQENNLTVPGPLVGLMVTLLICMQEMQRSNLGRNISYPDWKFYGIPESLQASFGMAPRLGHNRFLPNPF
jgi:hypothetical protein